MKKKLKQKLRYETSMKTNEEKWFVENGGMFLEKLIAYCNGKSVPIRNFSSSKILKATNNFDSSFCFSKTLWPDEWYIGIIEDKSYLIKKFPENEDDKDDEHDEDVYNDIVLSARMSNHNNFLRLVGCCFEFRSPVFVFEYEEYACLNYQGYIKIGGEYKVSPWSVRLKIAKEIAIAVTYLHTAFPRIIIHKNITPINIFVDKNWNVKLTDFRLSVTLPLGKTRIAYNSTRRGPLRYVDPLYIDTSTLSQYADVYSVGICLLDFLNGRSTYAFYLKYKAIQDPKCILSYVEGLFENEKLDEIVDPMMANDFTSDQILQAKAWLLLALRCCEKKEENRPKMIQVAKALKRIERNEQSLDALAAIGFSKPEILEDGPSVVKSVGKFKSKIEIILAHSYQCMFLLFVGISLHYFSG